MLIEKLLPGPRAAELPVLQAAQFAGFTQAIALLKRLSLRASDIEKSDFKLTGETIRPFEHYPVKLAEVLEFEHLAEDQAKGLFSFRFPGFQTRIGVSLQHEIFLTRRSRDLDGFEQVSEFDRWRPIQAGIWLYFHGIFTCADRSLWPIDPPTMEGDADLVTKFIDPE